MKKNFKKYLAILLAVVTVLSTFALASCNPNGLGKKEDTTTELTKISHGLSMETQNSPFMKLSATTGTRATAKGNVLEYVLTATVLPESADNKAVTWSVNWEDTTRTEIVSSYVMAVTEENGSNVATVTCYRPFTGNIVITVTTVEGGFTASCVVKYVGLPSAMEVDLSNANMVTDSAWGVDVVEVGIGETTYHEIALSNIFGEPGADFTPEYDVELVTHGGILVDLSTYAADGSLIGTEQIELPIHIRDAMDTSGYCVAYVRDTVMINYMYVGIKDGLLFLAGQKYPEAMSWKKTNDDGTTTQGVFAGFADGKEPYVTATLTEKTTGITYTFNVRTVGSVSEVILDSNEIIF